MHGKWKAFLPLAALVLVIAGAALAYTLLKDRVNMPDAFGSSDISAPADSTLESQISRTKAPDITVYDAEGRPVTLSSLQGTPVVLNFWASWCGPCKMEMPDFQDVYEELGQQVSFVMVNLTDGSRETVEKAREHIREQGYTFPVYFDTGQDAAVAYGIYSIPTTYILDKDGYIIGYTSQMIHADTLRDFLQTIL